MSISRSNKKALLIGLNYKKTSIQLRGCENDTRLIKYCLVNLFQYNPNCVNIKTDYHFDTEFSLKYYLRQFLEDCQSGDTLLFHYSGHGIQITDSNHIDEHDGKDEVIYDGHHLLVDDEIKMLLSKVPVGVRLIMILDCCHSGTLIDLPFVHRPDSSLVEINHNHLNLKADIIVISSCLDQQISTDAFFVNKGRYHGALTATLLTIMERLDINKLRWRELLKLIFNIMKQHRLNQTPVISSTRANVIDEFVLIN